MSPDPLETPAHRWLRWAEEDLALAVHCADDPDVVARGACTWAHQAAEKALKAMLVANDQDPPKIHDLTRLSRTIADVDDRSFDGADLTELTRWSIEGRYPGDIDDATHEDALQAITSAQVVIAFAHRRLDRL